MTTGQERRAAALRERLGVLERRLDTVDESLHEPHSKDWEEAAVEQEGDEVLEDLGRAGQAEIARIRAALKRIEEGTYGECVRCGEEISPDRLDLVPETPFCRRCAE